MNYIVSESFQCLLDFLYFSTREERKFSYSYFSERLVYFLFLKYSRPSVIIDRLKNYSNFEVITINKIVALLKFGLKYFKFKLNKEFLCSPHSLTLLNNQLSHLTFTSSPFRTLKTLLFAAQ